MRLPALAKPKPRLSRTLQKVPRRAREHAAAADAGGHACPNAIANGIHVLRRVFARYDEDTKRKAIAEVFERGIKKYGTKRTVANKYDIDEGTLKGWLAGQSTAASAIAKAVAARSGRKTLLPAKVEAAIAALVYKCWRQNRSLNRLAVLAIATDTAKEHGIEWQVRWDQVVQQAVFCCFCTCLTASTRAEPARCRL
jgi:transposase-like protein